MDVRRHRLDLQALTVSSAIATDKKQLYFLRATAERILFDAQMRDLSGLPQDGLAERSKSGLSAEWGFEAPDGDAAIHVIGENELSDFSGLVRDAAHRSQDLHLARVMSQILPLQHKVDVNLAQLMFIATSGIVVAHPPIDDRRVRTVLKNLSNSKIVQRHALHSEQFDVTFDPSYGRDTVDGPRMLFATPIVLNDDLRGAIVFDVPQQRLQEYLGRVTPADELLFMLDEKGELVSASRPFEDAKRLRWSSGLETEAAGTRRELISKGEAGLETKGGDLLLFRRLESGGMILISSIPGSAFRLAVVSQFSAVFFCIWVLLGVLLVGTLYLVDRLLKRQLALNHQLREIGLVDALTQLANRRRLKADFDGVMRRGRGEAPIAVILLDIDRFKFINDNWGHAAGDEVLKHLATICRALVRPQDLVVRYGGEEFCVMLPLSTRAQAFEVAEKLRIAIAHSVCIPDSQNLLSSAPSHEIKFTASLGVAECRIDESPELDGLMAVADRRLYIAKKAGGNFVVQDDQAF
jgi:diguanylate cyclase (GGDEF)-like protein